MRTRRFLAELALAFGAAALVLAIASDRQAVHAAEPASPVSWQGLVADGPRSSVHIGQQMIVVLKSPSLADRVALHGGLASDKQEQTWTSSLLAQQRLLRSRLQVQGVEIHPEYSFTRVLSGFSAALDASAVSLLERDSAVQGVYPVRVAYPASVTSEALARPSVASSVGNADLSLRGFDGRGVTIALLDTGVDRLHPSLIGSVASGIDVLDPTGDGTPQGPPGQPNRIERHGTELAGLLVGAGGPGGIHGAAPGGRAKLSSRGGSLWISATAGMERAWAEHEQRMHTTAMIYLYLAYDGRTDILTIKAYGEGVEANETAPLSDWTRTRLESVLLLAIGA